MTLRHSKYRRYDIDERLTLDAPTTMKGPLELLSSGMERNSAADILACDSNSCSPQSLPVTSTRTPPRSIFPAYWKTDPRPSRPSPISSEVEKRQQQQQRQSHPPRRIIHKTFAYSYDRDPYQFYGIEEDKTSSTSEDDYDSDSLNSYEFNLRKNEAGIIAENHQRRSRTCPSLSLPEVGIRRMVELDRTHATFQSDTVLYAKTSRRMSCLRKSRFSFDANGNRKDDDDGSSSSTNSNHGEGKGEQHRTSVSFEPRIKVHLFVPPVEKWAPNGWSNWFGGWH